MERAQAEAILMVDWTCGTHHRGDTITRDIALVHALLPSGLQQTAGWTATSRCNVQLEIRRHNPVTLAGIALQFILSKV